MTGIGSSIVKRGFCCLFTSGHTIIFSHNRFGFEAKKENYQN